MNVRQWDRDPIQRESGRIINPRYQNAVFKGDINKGKYTLAPLIPRIRDALYRCAEATAIANVYLSQIDTVEKAKDTDLKQLNIDQPNILRDIIADPSMYAALIGLLATIPDEPPLMP